MALGLSTYQWNNNIKSVVLLAAFPFLLLLLLGIVFYATGWASLDPQGLVDHRLFVSLGLDARDVLTRTPWDLAQAGLER